MPPRASVLIDATVFVYHHTGGSAECRAFLARCARGDFDALTSVVVLGEVAHRLMAIEAVARGLVPAGQVARKLRERPELVRGLSTYADQVEQIPSMGIRVVPLDLGLFLQAREMRQRHGLMVNDSLLVATAIHHGVEAIASADRDFDRVDGLRVFRPTDLAR